MGYTSLYIPEVMAGAKGEDLSISFKQSVEVCKVIRNKNYDAAEKFLMRVIKMEDAVPYKKFNRGGVGHRKGNMGPGRYPIKTSKEILRILKSAYSNADDKEIEKEDIKVFSAVAQKGSKTMKNGRFSSRIAKRTQIEIILVSDRMYKDIRKLGKMNKADRSATIEKLVSNVKRVEREVDANTEAKIRSKHARI